MLTSLQTLGSASIQANRIGIGGGGGHHEIKETLIYNFLCNGL